MHINDFGALPIPLPLFEGEDGGTPAGQEPAKQDSQDGGTGKESPSEKPGSEGAEGSEPKAPVNHFEGLEKDNLTWLEKTGLDKDLGKLAKTAYEQEKLVGASVRLPGEKATDEDRAKFWNKLGRPEEAEKYEFAVPDKMPENLPYDGDRATAFKGFAHSIGLSQSQAAELHDYFVADEVKRFEGAAESEKGTQTATAQTVTDALIKRWGPLDGEQAKTNLELGDKALLGTFGPEGIAELKALGAISEDGMILSEHLAVGFAKLGAALFKEDGQLRGDAAGTTNPFEEGDNFNLTDAMAMVKKDPDKALVMIAAAGKKPKDFGLAA